jgi:hypothetical protein
MKIDRVTLTGADDSIDPADLVPIYKEYKFVEWGVLLSRSQGGNPEFPSSDWINELRKKYIENGSHHLNCAGHICGAWVRDLVQDGSFTLFEERPWQHTFRRLQLNFMGKKLKAHKDFWTALNDSENTFIFQLDGENDDLYHQAAHKKINAVPFFDKSGGTGKSPKDWPAPIAPYTGYAGGLGPDNLEEELDKMAFRVGRNIIWIDMQAKLRTDGKFDLNKAVKCLEIAKKWV